MIMADLLPIFGDFCREEILNRDFDYIMPIESKGMLVLEQALPTDSMQRSRVLFRRAFDFIKPEELHNKKVAVIDDTVVVGRTLHASAEYLKTKGIADVSKYAFILYDDSKNREFRRLDGVDFCSILDKQEYLLILEELSQLSMKERPTYPDHIIIHAHLDDSYPTDVIAELCRSCGTFVEYSKPDTARVCSVHYPTFAPSLPPGSRDSGPNKLRLALAHRGDWITFSPALFPSLTDRTKAVMSDPLAQQFQQLLTCPWQSGETKLMNLYESFTLSMRTHMARNFTSLLLKKGIGIKNLQVDSRRLKSYYSEHICSRLVKIIMDEISSSADESSSGVSLTSDETESPDVHTLTKELLTQFDLEYKAANDGVSDKFQWKSAGLNIDQLAERTGYSKIDVSIGVEILNSYGYATPMFSSDHSIELQRLYRSTEIGTIRLRS